MPVIVQTLEDASYQDQQDLQKIYRDAPQWLFAPFSGAADLIENALADGCLIAGRFNDRLLGAGRLQRHHDVWYLVPFMRAKNYPASWSCRATGEPSAENGVASGGGTAPAGARRTS